MRENNRTKNYPIFSFIIARTLIHAGFVVKDIQLNKNNAKNNKDGKLQERDDLVVFFFEDTPEMRAVLTEKVERSAYYKNLLTLDKHNSVSNPKE